MIYYGTHLSENISRREPEGYLICLNVPVARTGVQEYLPRELDLPSGPGTIPVWRPPEEVFSPETISSFEGMPVTDNHPPDGVDANNIRSLQKGHAHNVRRGTGEQADLLLADLLITDPLLIDRILNEGKREISCGYNYQLCYEDGRYIQRRIRGNHIAVVDQGRAGPRVSIHDKASSQQPNDTERSTLMKKPVRNSRIPQTARHPQAAGTIRQADTASRRMARVLARMARDGDVETVAEILEEMSDPTLAETAQTVPVAATPVATPVQTMQPAQVAAVPMPAAQSVVYGPMPVQTIPAEAMPIAVPAAAPVSDPTLLIPEGEETAEDDDFQAAVLEKLDLLIALLTPPAGDEDPENTEAAESTGTGGAAADPADLSEVVSEAVSEAVTTAVTEAMAGAVENLVEEVVHEDEDSEEDLSGIPGLVESLDPTLSSVLEPEEETDECEEDPALREEASDALRVALTAIRPALANLPRAQRRKVAADIAAKLQLSSGRKAVRGNTPGAYAALAARSRARDSRSADPAELGRRIMATRNANYKK